MSGASHRMRFAQIRKETSSDTFGDSWSVDIGALARALQPRHGLGFGLPYLVVQFFAWVVGAAVGGVACQRAGNAHHPDQQRDGRGCVLLRPIAVAPLYR